MALAEYRRKRDFKVTAEPEGVTKSSGRSIFCVQKHAASHLHYDFRLELDGVLLSWAVPKGPSLNPATKRLAMHVEDHPLDYAQFEGTIPQGEYGGGTVVLWDLGAWEPEGDPRKAYRDGNLKFTLHGEKLRGHWHLIRSGGRRGNDKQWLLFKSKDEEASDGEEITVTHPLSVKTGRDLDEVAAGKPAKKKKRTTKLATQRPASRVARTKGAKAKGAKVKRSVKSSSTEPAKAGRASARAKARGLTRSAAGGATRKRRSRNADAESGSEVTQPDSTTQRLGSTLPFEPQLATLADEVPRGDQWIHEQKFDGYRMLCLVDNGQVMFVSRNGHNWTDKFPVVADAVRKLRFKQVIFDGEIAALDEQGVSRFQLLQNAFGEQRADHLKYFVFDVLFHNGRDLRDLPLERRKTKLEKLLAKAPAEGVVQYSAHRTGNGERFLQDACRGGEEGIISKRRDLPYHSGRSLDWLKIKCTLNQEFVIGGYTNPQGARTDFGALLVGYYDRGELRYAGKVGTGFNQKSLADLMAKFEPLEQRSSPFADLNGGMAEGRKAHWIAPRLVCQITFTQWTEDNRLRHPVFQGLREDKAPKSVVREQIVPHEKAEAEASHKHNGHAQRGESTMAKKGGRKRSASSKTSGRRSAGNGEETEVLGVRLTSPDKVLYAEQGITKLDLARYYEQVAEWMLPHIHARPLSLVRCPEGAGKACFYQKHLGAGMPTELRQVEIEEERKTGIYVVAEQAEDLIALAQIGALEIHGWGSRADRLENPDQMVFDLDPAPDVRWSAVVAAAQRIRQLIEGLGLNCLLKTTGGKGLHLVVPIIRRHTWDEVTAFSKALADAVSSADPDHFTSNMSKKARVGKIFIDYLRNSRGATAIAPYSTRAKPGAPVATPIAWDELSNKLKSDAFNLFEVPQRLKKLKRDPWEDFNSLKKAIPRSAWETLGQEPP